MKSNESLGVCLPAPTARRTAPKRNPQKRQQQNQRAQKKYRQRQKERLSELEAQVALLVSTEKPSLNRSVQPVEKTDVEITSDPSQTISSDFAPDLPYTNSTVTVSDFAVHHWQLSLFDCGCQTPHVKLRTRRGEPTQALAVASLNLLPDPSANHLRVEVLCIISAFQHNCFQLGVSDIMSCEDGVSLFFRQMSSDTCASEMLISAVQQLFQTLKPDLRPTREQIVFSHHPSIDILPFPTLRQNILQYTGLIDEDEFFDDFLHEAKCWGRSSSAISNGFDAGLGMSWDV
ncbi:hypothetical protein FALBO_16985 [Fusarium albosuccineum]|uniref:BZIP domain-containing protein n=1 Tax=Fusarium albosuccineum TaxID=1237068 RepID=A0A8H4KCP2_9HYPO|nr:hypothetical protein FALBO_16985 [Fusarium albosuccineum]